MTQNQKEAILNRLTEMGCKNIVLEELSDKIVAHFDCEELTSFNAPIEGWTYTGIELDDSNSGENQREFKIIFTDKRRR